MTARPECLGPAFCNREEIGGGQQRNRAAAEAAAEAAAMAAAMAACEMDEDACGM